MKEYESLEHTADLKIRAYGKDLPELFFHALKGMFEICRPEVKKQSEVIRRINVSATDLEALLIEFLSQALYLSDVNDEAYFQAEINIKDKSKKKSLKGKIKGKKLERLGLEIKAVTWHDLSVKKNNDHWEAVVLFDI
ncbi:archease [Patescibacteria group bacterium AH-259-L05]|nr:archease [Patescibacteria group bacterium AH-259-L05]